MKFVNEEKDSLDWYAIREKAKDIWKEIINKENMPSENDMNITMVLID